MQPIRIGHTYLRIREIGHVVERERLAATGRGMVPILGAMVLGVVLLGIYALNIWFSQTSESVHGLWRVLTKIDRNPTVLASVRNSRMRGAISVTGRTSAPSAASAPSGWQ